MIARTGAEVQALLRSLRGALPHARRSSGDEREPTTLNEYVRYLRGLGINLDDWSPLEYADRVAERIGIAMEIRYCNDHRYRETYEQMSAKGYSGMTLRDRNSGDAEILIREDLPYSQQIKSLLHEIEHVVCGHKLRTDAVYSFVGRSVSQILADYARHLRQRPTQRNPDPSSGSDPYPTWWKPTREMRLLPQDPPEDPDRAEHEAEARAALALKVLARGGEVYRSDTWLFARQL